MSLRSTLGKALLVLGSPHVGDVPVAPDHATGQRALGFDFARRLPRDADLRRRHRVAQQGDSETRILPVLPDMPMAELTSRLETGEPIVVAWRQGDGFGLARVEVVT